MGVWGFNEKYTIGVKVFKLPLEEILFFICIPFACLFTYHCLNTFFSIRWNKKAENAVIAFFSGFLLIIGVLFIDRLYTSVTFISTAVLLVVLKFVVNVKWLPGILTIYPILLLPFFIVNGILTGTCLSQPVVWYNDSEDLGIRLITIPVEDIIYGLEMILINLLFYEKLKQKFRGVHEIE